MMMGRRDVDGVGRLAGLVQGCSGAGAPVHHFVSRWSTTPV